MTCPKDRICESPHLLGAAASVGIEEKRSTRHMIYAVICDGCPLPRHRPPRAPDGADHMTSPPPSVEPGEES